MQSQSPRQWYPGRLLMAAVLIATFLLGAAATAAAAPTPTVLTVTAQSTTVDWGTGAILNGVLQTTEQPPRPVDQQQVRVESSQYSNGPWQLAETVTNTAGPYSSGAYTYGWIANSTSYWRMVFPGTEEWGGVVGNVVLVRVRAVLGRPGCPAGVRAGSRFTVSGTLKPRFPAGSRTVQVKAQRYSGGKWRAYKSYSAANANSGSYSKYSVRIRITRTGKYRFYATTGGTSTLAGDKSAYSRTLRVR